MNKEVRLAFYRAAKGTWTDWLIAGYTWLFNMKAPLYSHVEIGFDIDGEWRYFSSSIRDNGTRWKRANDVLRNPDKWDIYSKEYPVDHVERMISRCVKIMGKQYDKLGIFGFVTVTGMVANKKDHWYCSEACFYVLTSFWNKRISPMRFWGRIKDDFKPIKGEER